MPAVAVLYTINPFSAAPGAGEIGAPTFVAVKGRRGISTPLLFPGLASMSNNAEELGALPVVFMPTFWASPIPESPKGRSRKVARKMIFAFKR